MSTQPENVPEPDDATSETLPAARDDTPIEDEPVQEDPRESPAGVLSGVPKQVRQTVEMFMGQMIRSGGPPSPIWDKVTSEHVPLIVKSLDRTEELEYQDAQRRRWFTLVYCALGVAVLVFLVVALGGSNPDLLEKLLVLALGFIGGFGGGYGYKASRDRSG